MNWQWILITAALAAITIGVGVLSHRNPVTDAITELPPQPAYYLKDAIVTETETSGAPSLRLIAKRIEQQPTDNSIELQTVRVDYLKVPDKRWYLSAQRGLVPPDSHVIQFLGNVELRPTDGPATTFLRTEELSVDPEKNLAYTTTSPVAIRFGTYAMRVKRFEANLKTEKVRMESVNGRSEAG
ncbi:MAG TPA: LPS export ABC transporter periplasmic protein LptC [Povalibacter sp.]|mgnify:CR=1 FL=1|uniref:LPS export ABC transporter periplasmic protein LptC n=1 Tax=Povalibacter sp. TaxID=1962978 RepID=UPI002C58D6C4|nr:LPS export ABC transporter periplasmic protein LptC [Povalibacter sp.]HMN45339.1 LPS export ABC transporter periplasmic protein LptC [Povalibacter sp.]